MAQKRYDRYRKGETLPVSWVPQFKEAEDFVLGTLIAYPDFEIREGFSVVNAYRESELTIEHFKTEQNRVIAAEVWELLGRDERPEYFAVLKRLNEAGRLEEAGGTERLNQLITNVQLMPARAEQYAQALVNLDARWKVFQLAHELGKLAHAPEGDSQHLYNRVRGLVEALEPGRKHADVQEAHEVALTLIGKLGERATRPNSRYGVPTGFADLDNMLGGWNPSDLIILAARPSIGKTSLALSTVARAARYASVLVFSLEMSAEQITQRLLAIDSSIPSEKFKRPQDLTQADWDKLDESIGRYADSTLYRPIFINDTSGLTFGQISSISHRMYAAAEKLRKSEEEGPPLFIVIDYLQLIDASDLTREGNRTQELSVLTRKLKNLARELNVPIMVLSQLSRDIEKRQGHIPVLADLRESGAIEQDSDIVLFIHRPDVYNDGSGGDANPIAAQAANGPVLADLIIAKHRNGPCGKVVLQFTKECTRYDGCEQGGDGQLAPSDGADDAFGFGGA